MSKYMKQHVKLTDKQADNHKACEFHTSLNKNHEYMKSNIILSITCISFLLKQKKLKNGLF